MQRRRGQCPAPRVWPRGVPSAAEGPGVLADLGNMSWRGHPVSETDHHCAKPAATPSTTKAKPHADASGATAQSSAFPRHGQGEVVKEQGNAYSGHRVVGTTPKPPWSPVSGWVGRRPQKSLWTRNRPPLIPAPPPPLMNLQCGSRLRCRWGTCRKTLLLHHNTQERSVQAEI